MEGRPGSRRPCGQKGEAREGEGHSSHGDSLPMGDKNDTFALWALGSQEVFER